MRAIVVDDERLIAEHIDRLLADAGVEVVGCCTNPYEALEMTKALRPDVLFLDIEMPEMSGLDIAEKVYSDNLDSEVVFITAYNQYAIDAFRVNALDYLLKPIMEEDLNRSLERIRKRRKERMGAAGMIGNRQLSASLFGKFSVYIGDDPEPVRWVTSKCAELFAYMLLQQEDKEVSKWQLFEALWNEKNTEKADINLRSTVSRVNKTLRDLHAGMSLTSVRNGYRLTMSGDAIVVDADPLESFALDSVEIGPDNLNQVEQLVYRCNHPFLKEFSGEWCEPYRNRYRQYFLYLGGKLFSYYERVRTEPLKALRLAEMLVDHDPYNDSLRAAALKLRHQLEGRKRAAAYYEAYAKLLRTELGTEPGDALTDMFHKLTD
ncbi:response regulator [Cohnella candidum]|uniref:response regulator n=1 Tax=Cohnella candidum TaxID=2674991 RepID=UPI0013DDB756|nr:response regulator [Cohnella candidum]